MIPGDVKKMVLVAIPDAKVEVLDMTGTGDHFEVTVTSKIFQGKSLIEQHKIVFKALEPGMNEDLHAVKIKTKVPA